jgi:hypothetical protein
VPPLKDPITYQDFRFSEWLESMRKDVECTFGIMKGRFRILKTGVRLHGIKTTDRIWLTCCALHNMFLDEDGLADKWENGLATDWDTELGQHDTNDVRKYCRNFAIRRLNTPDEKRNLDLSGIGFGNDESWNMSDSEDEIDIDIESIGKKNKKRMNGVEINCLSLNTFRKYLIEHFDYKFRLKMLKWPSRLKMQSESERLDSAK